MSLSDWQLLDQAFETIVRHSGATFEPATVANARDLLALMRDK